MCENGVEELGGIVFGEYCVALGGDFHDVGADEFGFFYNLLD